MQASISAWLSVWSGIAGGIVAVGVALWPAARLLRRWLVRSLAEQIQELHDEVTPNGGTTTSSGDRMQRIEEMVAALYEDQLAKDAPRPTE